LFMSVSDIKVKDRVALKCLTRIIIGFV